uniref:Uncharacterized protein n=1 Tax=Arundo donax TaxID=35708 RepID=A0A0A9GXQ9_ARUDO
MLRLCGNLSWMDLCNFE